MWPVDVTHLLNGLWFTALNKNWMPAFAGQKFLTCVDAGMSREQDAVETQATFCIHHIPVVR
jgi:hypothetical protein